ncbi:MAG: metallophosphoesterase [Sulfitobacter sp.]
MAFRLPQKPVPQAPLAPAAPFYAIGDIHGHADQLIAALRLIDSHNRPAPILCLGDYIDRGSQSLQVLARLQHEETTRGTDRFICLLGNHEKMLLDCLDDPKQHLWKWIRAGGSDTAGELGLQPPPPNAPDDDWRAFAIEMRTALTPRTLRWLQKRPYKWQSGNILAVHAGADPATPIDTQNDKTCLWGHKDFLTCARKDQCWVLHGHTIVQTPTSEKGRIAIDTGVYKTKRLTVAYIEPKKVSFFEV